MKNKQNKKKIKRKFEYNVIGLSIAKKAKLEIPVSELKIRSNKKKKVKQ